MRTVTYTTTIVLALMLALSARAQVMESTNYRIQSDSVNVGGARGESANYTLETTVGEIATGYSGSASYTVSAGYQGMQATYLAITDATDVTMLPPLAGNTSEESNGSTTARVTTDSNAGYQLTIAAEDSPAMQSGSNTIANYTPAGVPDFTFAVAAGTAEFGFSPEGADVAARYLDDGSACNTGAGDTTLACWDAITTTPVVIASRAAGNHPMGTETLLQFRVGVGVGATQAAGTYVATTTLTAISL